MGPKQHFLCLWITSGVHLVSAGGVVDSSLLFLTSWWLSVALDEVFFCNGSGECVALYWLVVFLLPGLVVVSVDGGEVQSSAPSLLSSLGFGSLPLFNIYRNPWVRSPDGTIPSICQWYPALYLHPWPPKWWCRGSVSESGGNMGNNRFQFNSSKTQWF